MDTIVEKVSKNPPHILALKLIIQILTRLLREDERFHLSSQDPIRLNDSEPEPDVAILRGTMMAYATRIPTNLDTPLVIEIADSTLKQDQTIRKNLYAGTGISTILDCQHPSTTR